MTINLEREVVATRFDAQARLCYYTVERDGRRWTVGVKLDDLDALKGDMARRRIHLGNVLTRAMQGKADGEA